MNSPLDLSQVDPNMIDSLRYKGSPAMARAYSPLGRSQQITNATVSYILVRSTPSNRCRGRIEAGNLRMLCALGKGGVTTRKREGDGGTPVGTFAMRKLWYRSDHGQRPSCGLPMRATRQADGWCDAASHRRYNKPVQLPFPASHEKMWRDDHLYDCVIEIGWNDHPTIANKGSAIFLHLARPGYTPTEGCVAVNRRDMAKLLKLIGPRTRIDIR